MIEKIAPAQLWLGACVGAQVLMVFLSVIKANAYHERAFLLHGAATLMAVLAVQSLLGQQPLLPPSVLLLVLALAGVQLLDLLSHAGGLRRPRRWLLATCAIALPLLVAAGTYTRWAMVAGMVLWTAVVVLALPPLFAFA